MSNWPTAKLGEVCLVRRGTTITQKQARAGAVPVIGGGTGPSYYHDTANRPPGAITISGSGNAGYVNRYAMPIFASDCSTVEPRDERRVLADFVFRFLQSKQEWIYTELRQGAAQLHVYARDIAQIEIPLPPLEEQRRIVAMLDEAFVAIGTAAMNAERNLSNARELSAMFPANGGEKGTRLTIGELLERRWLLGHMDGNHGGDYPRKHEFVDAGVTYLSANCIRDGLVNFSRAKFLTAERAGKLRKGFATNRDVLFAHNATVGPVALLQTGEEFVVLGTSLTYYRCNEDYIVPEYLESYLRSPAFVEQYSAVMRQSTRNQVPITKQREFYVDVPPIAAQRRLVASLRGFQEEGRKLARFYQAKLESLSGLKQSLLRRAFADELTERELELA